MKRRRSRSRFSTTSSFSSSPWERSRSRVAASKRAGTRKTATEIAMPSTPITKKATVSPLVARTIIRPYGGGSGRERQRLVVTERERDHVRRLLLDHDAVLPGPPAPAAPQAAHGERARGNRGPDRDRTVGEHGGEHDLGRHPERQERADHAAA